MKNTTLETGQTIAEAIIDAHENFDKETTLKDILTGGVIALHAIYLSQLDEGEHIGLIEFAEDLPRLAAMFATEVAAASGEEAEGGIH